MAQTLGSPFKDVWRLPICGPALCAIDYLTDQRRLSLYTPDFIARKTDGTYVLIETKGRVDKDVPLKASAAVGWCKAASAAGEHWEYLYVPGGHLSGIRRRFDSGDLESVCATHLADLITEHVELAASASV